MRDSLLADDINWISIDPPSSPFEAYAKPDIPKPNNLVSLLPFRQENPC